MLYSSKNTRRCNNTRWDIFQKFNFYNFCHDFQWFGKLFEIFGKSIKQICFGLIKASKYFIKNTEIFGDRI